MALNKKADVRFPTKWATFRLMAFEAIFDEAEQKPPQSGLALILGDIDNTVPLVRIHSQCVTGDIFHSLRCDCHDQLHLALRTIAHEKAGILLYEYQEGRGIGLAEKLRAYELQDEGVDTIEANLRLGHPVDLRDYRLPIEILRFLNVRSLRLMTNNPQKIEAVQSAGIRIRKRIAADVPATVHSIGYMATKRDLLGHLYGGEIPGTPMGTGSTFTEGKEVNCG
ncbi:MAG: GTP cyclohydrolase II [Acidobacteriota bacterium]